MEEIIGLFAGIITTACFIPQIIVIIRTKDVAAISLFMYIMFFIGVSLWEIYGWLIGSWAVIIANILTLSLTSVIIFYKIKYR